MYSTEAVKAAMDILAGRVNPQDASFVLTQAERSIRELADSVGRQRGAVEREVNKLVLDVKALAKSVRVYEYMAGELNGGSTFTLPNFLDFGDLSSAVSEISGILAAAKEKSITSAELPNLPAPARLEVSTVPAINTPVVTEVVPAPITAEIIPAPAGTSSVEQSIEMPVAWRVMGGVGPNAGKWLNLDAERWEDRESFFIGNYPGFKIMRPVLRGQTPLVCDCPIEKGKPLSFSISRRQAGGQEYEKHFPVVGRYCLEHTPFAVEVQYKDGRVQTLCPGYTRTDTLKPVDKPIIRRSGRGTRGRPARPGSKVFKSYEEFVIFWLDLEKKGEASLTNLRETHLVNINSKQFREFYDRAVREKEIVPNTFRGSRNSASAA